MAMLLFAAIAFPPQWYPLPLRLQLSQWFGASAFRGLPATMAPVAEQAEKFCP